jgi:hypothetical protein
MGLAGGAVSAALGTDGEEDMKGLENVWVRAVGYHK